jgi:hypothetical protein
MLVATREHVGMEESTKRKLEEIIGQMKCPKDFLCYKSGFKILCKAEDVGMKSYLKCLEENPSDCVFSMGYAESHYCTCPLRCYIAKKEGK